MLVNRRSVLLGGAAVSAGILVGVPSLRAEDEIKIASILDESGGLSEWGDPEAKCMTLAVEEINDGGGLLGRKIKYIRYDTQSNDQLYAQYATEASLSEEVAMVHGAITSASREVIRPILGRNKTLYWYSCGYEGGVCDMNTFVSGTTPTMVVKALIDWAVPQAGKKIYIIAADYNAPQATAKYIEQYSKENGGEVIGKDFYPFEVSDFSAAISKIQAAKPDIIYSMLIGAPHLSFYRQWAASGMKDSIPIVSHFFGGGNEQVLLTPEEGDGIVSAWGYWEDIQSDINKNFVERYAKRFGDDHPYINAVAIGGYEDTMLWAEGVKKAGSFDRDKVIAALRSGIEWEGPSGKLTIDPKTNHVIRDVYIAKAKNKRVEVIKVMPQMLPLETQQSCDLVARPDTNTQYAP